MCVCIIVQQCYMCDDVLCDDVCRVCRERLDVKEILVSMVRLEYLEEW